MIAVAVLAFVIALAALSVPFIRETRRARREAGALRREP